MASIKFNDIMVQTTGELPSVGSKVESFNLTKTDLSESDLSEFEGKNVVLNIFPSIGTGVCQQSVRIFNEKLSQVDNTVVVCVSRDLPFAHKSFCEAEGLNNVIPMSSYKDNTFEKVFNVMFNEGPFYGLFSRAVVVLNENREVIHTEQVPVISQEPDYEKALATLELA